MPRPMLRMMSQFQFGPLLSGFSQFPRQRGRGESKDGKSRPVLTLASILLVRLTANISGMTTLLSAINHTRTHEGRRGSK